MYLINYFGYIEDGKALPMFSSAHIFVLILLFLSAILLFMFRRQLREPKTNTIARYVLIALLFFSELSYHIWSVYWGIWTFQESLPFQLCSFSIMLSIIMLFRNSHRLSEIVYFIGIGGAFQAMITPELYYTFPHFRYFQFFIVHIAIILASLFMIFVQQHRPTLKSIPRTFTFLNLLAVFVMIVNFLADANYMVLAHKPSTPSLLDFLGPYPWYILSLELVAAVMFFIMYVPIWLEQMYKKRKSINGNM